MTTTVATLALFQRIRLARMRARLTQAELASLIGVHRSAVSQWELYRGTEPTKEHLEAIATITRARYAWLESGQGSIEIVVQQGAGMEQRLVSLFRALPEHRQREAVAMLEDLVSRAAHIAPCPARGQANPP